MQLGDAPKGYTPVMLTPEQKSQRSRIAAHKLHGTHDSRELTEKAREAFDARFLDQADPDHQLPEAERKRRAEQLRKAYFTALAFKSSRARHKKKERQARAKPTSQHPCKQKTPDPPAAPAGEEVQ